jgi:hypothetical protein
MSAILEKAQAQKDAYSGTASEIVRQLAFAGIAVIWLFRVGGEDAGGVGFSPALLWPLAGFTVTLVLDLLQYVLSAIAWWLFYMSTERQIRAKTLAADAKVDTPWLVLLPNYICFFGKLVAIAVSYFFLMAHIVDALKTSGVAA